MNLALLVLSILAAPAASAGGIAPVYWSFPGPGGEELRGVMTEVQGQLGPEHLITTAAQDGFLKSLEFPEHLGCFDDSLRCADSERAVLSLIGLSARIEARHSREGDKIKVQLSSTRAEGGSKQEFSGEGADLESAAAAAFGAVVGKGTMVLHLDPPDANIRVDNAPFGQGSGEYLLAAGKHTLLIEAVGHKPLEQPITVPPDSRLTIRATLAVSDAKVTLKVKPPEALVFMDDEPWSTPNAVKEFSPGDHLLRVEAPGYIPYTETVALKSAVLHDLELKLRPKDPPWRKHLEKPHPDVMTNLWSVRFDVRLGSARDGGLDLEIDDSRTLVDQAEAMGLSGLGFTLSKDSGFWTLDILGLCFENGYGPASVRLSSTTQDAHGAKLSSLERTKFRALWVGARYPRWRVSPYAKTGFAVVMERLTGADQFQEFDVQENRLVMGTELGLKYRFSSDVYSGLGGHFDYWPFYRRVWTDEGRLGREGRDTRPDRRSSASVLVFAGYAFDVEAFLP